MEPNMNWATNIWMTGCSGGNIVQINGPENMDIWVWFNSHASSHLMHHLNRSRIRKYT